MRISAGLSAEKKSNHTREKKEGRNLSPQKNTNPDLNRLDQYGGTLAKIPFKMIHDASFKNNYPPRIQLPTEELLHLSRII